MGEQKIRIGTRGSPLAMKQARMVADALKAAHADLDLEIVPIKTSGDWVPEQGEKPLSEADGGKGQFAKEIERALLDGAIDCGVHSVKDLETQMPEGLSLDHVLPREDARDAFLSMKAGRVEDLPSGSTVGTVSPRRQALVKAMRPDLEIVPLRGNIQTRIDKLKAGQVDATILAVAGLKRMGLQSEIASYLEPEVMLPACCQGVIGIQTRTDDHNVQDFLSSIHCTHTGREAMAEREVLRILDGSCHTPIASYALLHEEHMRLRALVASEDGCEIHSIDIRETCVDRQSSLVIGRTAARRLKQNVPLALLRKDAA